MAIDIESPGGSETELKAALHELVKVMRPVVNYTGSELISNTDFAANADGWTLNDSTWSAGEIDSTTGPVGSLYPAISIDVELVEGQSYLLEVHQNIDTDVRVVKFNNNPGIYATFPGNIKFAFVSVFSGTDTLVLDFNNYQTGAAATTTFASLRAIDPVEAPLELVAHDGETVLRLGDQSNRNVAIGQRALESNTTGYDNVALGNFALMRNTEGANNIVLGSEAMISNTTGFGNVVFSQDAMYYNTTGWGNVAIGLDGLFRNTTGHQNIAIGYGSITHITTGRFITGVGAGCNISRGDLVNAAAVGYQANLTQSNTVQLGNADVTKAFVGLVAIGLPQHAIVSGGAAGDITVSGIKANDRLDEVVQYVYTAGAITDIVDLTSEFSIGTPVSGGVASFASNGSGVTTVTLASGGTPVQGSLVTISGTTNYNGTFLVDNVVGGTSFDINADFTVDDAAGSFAGFSADGLINNTGHTDTTGSKLQVRWTKLTPA